jgi:hypothetical protein
MRPRVATIAGPPQPPTPPKAPSPATPAASPRPPPVIATPEAPEAAASGPTEVSRPLPQIAVEAALADLMAFRREADRKISQLEAEVLRLGALTQQRVGEPTREMVALQPSMLPVWETSRAAAVAPAAVAAAAVEPAPSLGPVYAAAEGPAGIAVVSVKAHEPMDLHVRPGDLHDLPSALDGSRRKRSVVMFVVFLLVVGMGALIYAALASQGQHNG